MHTAKHAIAPTRKCNDGGKHVTWLRRQEEATPFEVQRHDSTPLSWAIFNTICEDFNIATGTPPSPPNALGHTARTVVNQPLGAFTYFSTIRPNFKDWSPVDRYLLDVTQARIAFVSVCTQCSVVASFPEDSPEGRRENAPDGLPCDRGPIGNGNSYWQVCYAST